MLFENHDYNIRQIQLGFCNSLNSAFCPINKSPAISFQFNIYYKITFGHKISQVYLKVQVLIFRISNILIFLTSYSHITSVKF